MAQEHNPLYDNQPVRFGFSISGINAKMKVVPSQFLTESDTLQRIESINFPPVHGIRLVDCIIGSVDSSTASNINPNPSHQLVTWPHEIAS